MEADDPNRVRDTSSRLDVSASKTLDEDPLPVVKFSRPALKKCSPSTISEGNGHGIIGRVQGVGLHLTSARFLGVRRTS